MKLLRNLESVRKNKPLAQSEIRSTLQSLKSRASNLSARGVISKAGGAAATSLNDGRLTRIEEQSGEAAGQSMTGESVPCEVRC